MMALVDSITSVMIDIAEISDFGLRIADCEIDLRSIRFGGPSGAGENR